MKIAQVAGAVLVVAMACAAVRASEAGVKDLPPLPDVCRSAWSPGCSNSSILVNPTRVIVLGDIHGDFDGTVETLKLAGIIDEDATWNAAPGTVLVQTGDVFDRGAQTVPSLQLLARLAEEAERAGGRVVQLLGNHEVACLNGFARMAHADEIDDFGGLQGREEALGVHGVFGQYLRELPAAAVVGNTVFVHGGIEPETARVLTLNGINEIVRRHLLPPSAHGFGSWATSSVKERCAALDEVCETYDAAEHMVLGENGPLWTRQLAELPEPLACTMLEETLRLLNENRPPMSQLVHRMVVGHTPQRHGPTMRCGGSLVLNDVALSRWIRFPHAGRTAPHTFATEISDNTANTVGPAEQGAQIVQPLGS